MSQNFQTKTHMGYAQNHTQLRGGCTGDNVRLPSLLQCRLVVSGKNQDVTLSTVTSHTIAIESTVANVRLPIADESSKEYRLRGKTHLGQGETQAKCVECWL